MSPLAERKCAPCEGGVAPLDPESARKMLASLNASWELSSDGSRIERRFEFPVYSRTIAFSNAVAWIATVEGHHPEMHIRYGHCDVSFSTTAIQGLSDNDFICAAKVDRLLGGMDE